MRDFDADADRSLTSDVRPVSFATIQETLMNRQSRSTGNQRIRISVPNTHVRTLKRLLESTTEILDPSSITLQKQRTFSVYVHTSVQGIIARELRANE